MNYVMLCHRKNRGIYEIKYSCLVEKQRIWATNKQFWYP